ncbi:hypothetical protein COLO4_27965 [Corchorus olitorius]|uniref:Uncharacterized protein n=1 Tax=Corchorus olitorius TaxID=93759 RepID=A0A1R3HNF5_9ROSI|nr:hypothetical protein COLO4_27965 [Corchorus olitorius]
MENAVSDGADGEESEDEDEESVEEGYQDDGFRGEEERGLLLLKRVEEDVDVGFDGGSRVLGEDKLNLNLIIDVFVDGEGERKRENEEEEESKEVEGVGFDYAVGYASNGLKIDL